jgi:hypothetical protein
MEIYNYVTDPDSSFCVEFVDGYSLRSLIELLRSITSTCNIHFSKDSITFEHGNQEQTAIIKWKIDCNELINYVFNSQSACVTIGINTSTLRQIAKNANKKDMIKFYKLPRDKNMYVEIGSLDKNSVRTSVSTLVSQTVEQVIYDVPEYTSPTCIVPSSLFSKVCLSLCATKNKSFLIEVSGKGLVFNTLQDAGTNVRSETLNNGFYNPSMDRVYIKVESSVLKAISKINNLTSQGILKIYSHEGYPLKLATNIGYYGKLEIYLVNSKE